MEEMYFPLLFTLVLVSGVHSGSLRRCQYGEYGEECAFVPAPPGRTPACAAPGYTYCEQLDYYPNDRIRHLVDKGEYDLSTLLSDESRDDFGATRPSQGPYGYGPHSLSGTQGISLVTERPYPRPQQYQPYRDSYRGPLPYDSPPPQYQNRQPYYNKQQGNSLPPPNGYVGYYSPSGPPSPARDSYLPPARNASAPAPAPAAVALDPADFWRGNSYFEVPMPPPYRYPDFLDTNGPYSSAPPAQGWHERPPRPDRRPPVTDYNPNDWWQRYTNDNRRADTSNITYKTVDSNEIKPHHSIAKRSAKLQKNYSKRTEKSKNTNPLMLAGPGGRSKRQAGTSGGEQLCPTRSQYIMPKAALNKEGNWMYVVNMGQMDNTYTQLVKSEVCVSQQCNGICSLPAGYSSRCEQRYVQKRLVALDQGGQRLYTDVFWFPSCCLCTISSDQL